MSGMPLAILDDGGDRGDPWRRPAFLRGTEQPVLERDESLLVRIADSVIMLETRVTTEQPWLPVWRSRRPGQATVTNRRVVVGCRRYDGGGSGRATFGPALAVVAHAAGYRRAGKCLGGHFRYEWVSDVGVRLGRPGEASLLMLTASEPVPVYDPGREWRLSVGSVPAGAYLPDLVALVANEVTQAHRRGAVTESVLDDQIAEGWPPLRRDPGTAGSVHIPGACALGTRPPGADARAWRA
jgi:hypothetical protein